MVFNEPHVFVMLTYCAGAWPGGHPDMLEVATSALPTGIYYQPLHYMAIAHNRAYDYIHQERYTEYFVGSSFCFVLVMFGVYQTNRGNVKINCKLEHS